MAVFASAGLDSTAIAALVLAAIMLALTIATVALVLVTRAATDRARADARAALELLRRQLAAGQRPLLVDVPPDVPVPADGPVEASHASRRSELQLPGMTDAALVDPREVFVASDGDRVYISVPLRNVGRGLAVVDEATVEIEGISLGPVEHRSVQRHQVPVGGATRVDMVAIRRTEDATPRGTAWELSVPYSDFVGEQRTLAKLQIVCHGEDIEGPWVVGRVIQEAAGMKPLAPIAEPAEQPEKRQQVMTDVWGQPLNVRRR
jgi:hypothetical protein